MQTQLVCLWWGSRSRPGLVSPELMSEKVLGNDLRRTNRSHRSQSDHSTIVSNYLGHLETCWACNPQYQEDSFYPHSPHDITLRWQSQTSTSPLSVSFPCLVSCLCTACMWHALSLQLCYFSKQTDHCQQECGLEDEIVRIELSWLPTQASRYSLRSVTASDDTSEAEARGLLEAKQTQSHKDLSLCVCSELWPCHLYDWITLAWHNTASQAACVTRWLLCAILKLSGLAEELGMSVENICFKSLHFVNIQLLLKRGTKVGKGLGVYCLLQILYAMKISEIFVLILQFHNPCFFHAPLTFVIVPL